MSQQELSRIKFDQTFAAPETEHYTRYEDEEEADENYNQVH
jgi:hypothetical protein